MKHVDYNRHAKATPLEALCFRGAAIYEPLLDGAVRAFTSQKFMVARENAGSGIDELVRASVARLDARENGRDWSYTKQHSLEVAGFVFIMTGEARRHLVGGPNMPEPEISFAGGLVHDIGKTFLPISILAKELGVNFGLFTAFKGAQLNEVERRILRREHLSMGTEFVRLFGAGEHNKLVLDMVGLHHVMYDGENSGVPSYPSLIAGRNLPMHAREGKVADFISAVKPRHYRTNGYIDTLDDAVAYAVASAGTELDPQSVACFMTGYYKVGYEDAMALISRLTHPEGRDGIMDIHRGRTYSRDIVRQDSGFRSIIAQPDQAKRADYEKKIVECAREFGVDPSDVWTS